MYTAEQIKPKKYPEEKPRMGYSIWVRSKVKNRWMRGWYTDQNRLSWASLADWFIDIPGAPPELKPLAYPQNKPEQDGLFIAHEKPHDEWDVIRWSNNCDWDSDVIDWFIPYRLDKENEMVFRENIWDTDEMKAEYDKSKPQMVALFDTSYGKPLNTIVVLADELTAFARHWLDLQGFDVVKREPEIKACPNCGYEQAEYREDYGGCWICLNSFCRLAGPHDDKDGNKWNSLPRKEE